MILPSAENTKRENVQVSECIISKRNELNWNKSNVKKKMINISSNALSSNIHVPRIFDYLWDVIASI